MKKYLSLILAVMALFAALTVSADAELLVLDSSVFGTAEKTAKLYEIKDSEYLDVSLKSAKAVTAVLESVPRTVNIRLRAEKAAGSTTLTIGNLEPGRTYYKFQDDYKNKAVFVSDGRGSHTWDQDISKDHHVWLQETVQTVFIPDDCATYGTWDAANSICTLSQDITGNVSIVSDNVILDCSNHNLTGGGAGYGIHLDGRSNVTVKNCNVSNYFGGISLWRSAGNKIINNRVSGCHININLESSSNNTLAGNTSGGASYCGIMLSSSPNNVLKQNGMQNSAYNFCVWGNNASDYVQDIDAANTVEGKAVYYLVNVRDRQIDSTFRVGFIAAIDSQNITVKDLNIKNSYSGILFVNTKNSRIENLDIGNSYSGIQVVQSRDIHITDNRVNADNFGIWLDTSSGITVGKNNVTGGNGGIVSSSSSGYPSANTITGNNVKNASWYGIAALFSSDNIIEKNNISGNAEGIRIEFMSSGNTVRENEISGNQRGIYIGGMGFYRPANNAIYRNNFINNLQRAQGETPANRFDNGYPDGGNYWSDHAGSDQKSGENQDQQGSDGIGDSPYTFLQGQDKYPFMKKDGWKKAYSIAVILAEPSDVSHESNSITAQPCKLLPQKTYPNGYGKEYYQDLAYCVADYHKENSFGTVNLDFEIFDDNGRWFKTDKKEKEYLPDGGREFVVDVISKANGVGIELSDNDMVIVLHAGTSGQREKGKLDSSAWVFKSQSSGYPQCEIIVAEDDEVGGWTHEVGHIIGALITPENTVIPDLSKTGNLNEYDLMARGSWNEDGKNPPYMSSYTREFLQWLNYDIHPKSAYGEYWINSLETSKLNDKVFRYNLSEDTNDGSQKYYILEARNRNLKTWDSSLPRDKALILYQVDTKGYQEYGYDEKEMMNNQYRKIWIPGLYLDGILVPNGDSYLDMLDLIQISALAEEQTSEDYRIKAEIEKVNFDLFKKEFNGVLIKPASKFYRDIIPYLSIENTSFQFELYSRKAFRKSGALVALWFRDDNVAAFEIVLLIFVFFAVNLIFAVYFTFCRKKKKSTVIILIIWPILFLVMVLVIYLYFIDMQKLADIYEKTMITLGWPEDNIPIPGWSVPNPLEGEQAMPDTDLHLYCDNGKHIGMNYQTSEYEVQIPEAIVSGDNPDAPEWIFIPASITNCRYAVSSHDNQKFLADNPEIAGQLADKTDSYETFARYIDPETGIYTSSTLTQTINPGQELEHAVSGTADVGIQEGVVTIATLKHEITNARELGLIDNQNIARSLLRRLDSAQKKLDRGSVQAARHTLNALKSEIKALKGRHVASDTADVLISGLESLIKDMPADKNGDFSDLLSGIREAVVRLQNLLPD